MDLNTLLAETAPPATFDLASDALARARARLSAEVSAAELRVRIARRTKRRRAAVISFASVAAAAGLVVAPTVDLGGMHRPDGAQAAAALVHVAAAAGDQPGGWPDATYWHVVSEQSYDGGPSLRHEVWLGRVASSAMQDAQDEATGDQLGPDGVYTAGLGPARFAPMGESWAGLYALPTDPTKLERVLRDGAKGQGPDPDSQLWSDIGELERQTPAPPALRAALWTVASRIPGVTLIGTVTDSAGRTGTAVERDPKDGWYRERFIIDPETGDVLEQLSYDTTGAVAYRLTILSQGPTDTAPAIDPPLCGPGSKPEHSC